MLALGTKPVGAVNWFKEKPYGKWPLRPRRAPEKEQYDTLSQIAKVVAQPKGHADYATPWQVMTRQIGTLELPRGEPSLTVKAQAAAGSRTGGPDIPKAPRSTTALRGLGLLLALGALVLVSLLSVAGTRGIPFTSSSPLPRPNWPAGWRGRPAPYSYRGPS